MSQLVIAHNATTARLIGADRATRLEVQKLLSYKVAGCEMSELFKTGKWNGRSTFYEWAQDRFPAGFVSLVYSHLVRLGKRPGIARKPFPEPLGPERPVVDAFPPDARYDYQDKVVDKLVSHGKIIAQVATGGGKSRIAKLAFSRIGRMTLFLTTRSILMHQMKDAFEADLGLKCGVLGDGEWAPRRGMNVGMVQTLMARLKDLDPASSTAAQRAAHAEVQAKTRKLLSMFELVILEEAHEAGGDSYFEILNNCSNAHYRLALTATPFMRDDEEDNMRLMAVSGPVAIKVSEKDLIERGILARPYFKIIRLVERPSDLRRSTPWQRAYKAGIVNNTYRNQAIVSEVRTAVQHGLTAMVLVQQTAHGDVLRGQLETAGIRCAYIKGENDQAERKRQIGRLKSGDIDVLIGTTILDVGVDVPAVGLVVLAGGGKAEVALRQRIGRGLRAKKSGPNVCLIVDFHDDGNEHLKGHAKTRYSIIAGTPGFDEGILSEGEDFDYGALGFVRMAA
ncbi:DEAD/DEAH box helicase [Chromobacterium phragmitis]|uniref:DEAD/DEAH box helicase n=1 Tax=Chromobacterium phragmitis TaxID=2202141 RepID=A0ABV0J0M1_9NEIS